MQTDQGKKGGTAFPKSNQLRERWDSVYTRDGDTEGLDSCSIYVAATMGAQPIPMVPEVEEQQTGSATQLSDATPKIGMGVQSSPIGTFVFCTPKLDREGSRSARDGAPAG